jgi:sortase A
VAREMREDVSTNWREEFFIGGAVVEEAEETAPVVVVPQPVSVAPTTFGHIVSMAVDLGRGRIQGLRSGVDRATAIRQARRAVAVAGVLLLVLAAFLSVAGGVTERRDQRELNAKFNDMLAAHAGYEPVVKQGEIPLGTPVAVLEIPQLHLRQVVIEGTTAATLAEGPGHLRSSVLPGQHGNAVIAGRRTTYGGPFHHIDRLSRGALIRVTTGHGVFRYRVAGWRSAGPGRPDQLGASMKNLLTLTTSDPPYRASRRLILVSELQGKPSAYPDPVRPAKVPGNEGSFFGNAGAVFPALGWDVALLVVLLSTRALYRRWRFWPAYLITSPIIIAIVFAWLQTMAALLPSTL